MRLLITAGAVLLLATPAAAQRLDTRRIDVRETATSTMCSFNAYPEITLIDATSTSNGKVATWTGAPAENPDVRMQLKWEPGKAGWRSPRVLGLGFFVLADASLARDKVSAANLIIDDGKPVPLEYDDGEPILASLREYFAGTLIFVLYDGRDPVGASIITSDSVVLEIVDSAGTSLRRYSWDVRKLRRAPELLQLVNWSCN